MRLTPFIPALLAFASALSIAAPRDIYDSDHNGLIEIEDLQDLNEIRNNTSAERPTEIQGTHLYGANGGCPASGCNGYELTRNLNFDTNSNGRFDEGDQFWNEGKGFEPIGNWNLKFIAQFNGNGFGIYNLNIQRPGQSFASLFGYAEQSYIHSLKLTADLATGKESGALLGYGWETRVENIQADVQVSSPGHEYIGGLIGVADNMLLSNIRLKAVIQSGDKSGGMVGQMQDSTLNKSALFIRISGNKTVGGLTGTTSDSEIHDVFVATQVNADVWAAALSGGSSDSQYQNIRTSGQVTIADSKYATAGGVVSSTRNDIFKNILVTVALPPDSETQRFIGALFASRDNSKEQQVYWASDYAGRHDSSARGYSYEQHFDLIDLRCTSPTHNCNGLQLTHFNDTNWDFGSTDNLPTIKLVSGIYRDDNADGEVENWPQLSMPTDPDPTDPDPTEPGKKSGSSGGALIWLLALAAVARRRR